MLVIDGNTVSVDAARKLWQGISRAVLKAHEKHGHGESISLSELIRLTQIADAAGKQKRKEGGRAAMQDNLRRSYLMQKGGNRG